MKKLSDAEFEIMQSIWEMEPPITARVLSEHLQQKDWKLNTLLTMLNRLVEKDVLRSEKQGKKYRVYFPTVTKEEYLAFETREFMKHYHGGNVQSLISALGGGKASAAQMTELQKLLEQDD